MHKFSISKKVLAIILAAALLFCCLPAMYAMADFTSVNLLTGAESKVDLANSTPVYYDKYLTENVFASGYGLSSTTVEGLVDGDKSTEYLFNGRGSTSRWWNGVRYALTEACFAEKLVIYSGLPAYIDCYEVYASDDLATLYRVGNYMGKFTCNGDAVEIPLNKSVQYFAVIYDQITSDNESARPREIELWSGDETDTFAPVCLTDSSPSKLASYSSLAIVPATMATATYNIGADKLEYIATNTTSNTHKDISQSGSNYTTIQYGFDAMYYVGDICLDAGIWNYDETWDIYASNSLANLYTAGSKVATVECKYASGARVSVNTYATYIGLVQTTGYSRIRAIRIYTADGTGVPEPFVAENILRTDTGLTATPFWQLISTGAVTDDTSYYYPVNAERFAAYTDGDTSTHKDMRGFTIGTYRVGARYELSSPAYIGDILVYASIGASYPETYSVYASSSLATLLDDANKLVDSEETTGSAITATVNGYVQYIAFVCESYTGNPRFREIEAWTAEAPAGPAPEPAFVPENILATNVDAARCVQFYPSSHYVGDASQITSETIGYLTDGDTTATHDCSTALDWDPPRYLGVEYTLDDTYYIGNFKIYSGYTTSIDTFDVYASDSLSDLYNDANLVASGVNCDNTGAQTIEVNKDVKYVTFLISGIELYCARIAEFEAWTADTLTASDFKSHSLVLTDAIGVNFFMDLGDLSAEAKAASYMTFDVAGESKTAAFDSTFVNASGFYGFTCYVSSVQMAEDVTPTFHYGSKTVTGADYSVKDYIDYVNENSGSFAAAVVTLVKAIGDYGHYAQEYLGPKNGWTAGTDYTVLAKYRAADYGTDDYTAKATALAVKEVNPSGTASGAAAGQFQFTLNFDSTTSIVLKLNNSTGANATSNYDGTVASDNIGGAVIFYLLKMPVSKLANVYNVNGSIDGNAYSIDISGLSYVYGVLNSGVTSAAAKNAVSALYDYYTAAVDYQASLS
ncbi:MAG: hypothetical protein J5852_09275 [Clostridia bacterium]|nr:hypothetical protein [Clostridia bacterium]